MNEDEHFCVRNKLLDTYNLNSRKYKLCAENVPEFKGWKKTLVPKLQNLLGIANLKKTNLNPKIIETKVFTDFTRKKVVLETEKDVFMPMYILIPNSIKPGEKIPCVIAPHGHGCGGKEGTAGRYDIPIIKESIEKYNCDYGIKLVKQGYIVFCNDARGFGERREWMDQGNSNEDLLKCSCNTINNAAISLGKSLLGMMVWDLIRIIDYIETLDYCNSSKIACLGFSGGGLQSLWLSALDERIKIAIISGYFHSFKGSIMATNFCGCNFVPNLWKAVDIGDLGALIAPRPLLIESGTDDPLNGSRGIIDVKEQISITKHAYNILNSDDKIYHHIFKGSHIFNGEKVNDFLKEHFNYTNNLCHGDE